MWKITSFFNITDDDADSDDCTHEINVLTLHRSPISHHISEVDQRAVAGEPLVACVLVLEIN